MGEVCGQRLGEGNEHRLDLDNGSQRKGSEGASFPHSQRGLSSPRGALAS